MLKSMHNYGIICHMSEAPEKKVNTETETPETQGLDQDKFADLFDSLDEETLMKMMESAGLFSEDADVSPEDVSDIVVPDTAPEVSPEAAAGAAADKEAMLSPEHIEHMLSVLGDDIIGDMLDSAGLTDEDVAAVLAEAKAEGEAAEAAADGTAPPAADKKGKPQGKRRKGRNVRRLLFVLIFIGILGLVAAVNKIYNSVTINSNDPIQYSEQTDEIYAEEGTLHVNNVSVTVPTNGTEEYSISYSWSEKDSKYPSVPHAITAIYPKQSEKDEETETVEKAGGDKAAGKEEGADANAAAEEKTADTGEAETTEKDAAAEESATAEEKATDVDKEDAAAEENTADAEQEDAEAEKNTEKLYSITLYRNETTPSKEIPKGKKVENWFDDWTVVNEGDVLQVPLKSGSINGFYIFPQPPSDNGAASDYNDFSYYFAIKDDEGISTYVIEGVCLDPEYDDEFRSVMDKCIHSISIDSEDKDSEDMDSEADDSENNEDNKESDTEQ